MEYILGLYENKNLFFPDKNTTAFNHTALSFVNLQDSVGS